MCRGKIIHLQKPHFFLSKFQKKDYHFMFKYLEKGESLCVLKPCDFISCKGYEKSVCIWANSMRRDCWNWHREHGTNFTEKAFREYIYHLELVTDELKKFGKIKAYEVLHLSSMTMLVISHFDVEKLLGENFEATTI